MMVVRVAVLLLCYLELRCESAASSNMLRSASGINGEVNRFEKRRSLRDANYRSNTTSTITTNKASAPSQRSLQRKKSGKISKSNLPKKGAPKVTCEQVASKAVRSKEPNLHMIATKDATCAIVIQRFKPQICKVKMVFTMLNSNSDVNIQGRSEDNARANSVPALEYVFPPSSHNLTLTFDADKWKDKYKSFSVVFHQIPDSCVSESKKHHSDTECLKVLGQYEDYLRSPNYPFQYPEKSRCTYVIKPASADVCIVTLEFMDFDLEESENCIQDAFRIPAYEQKLCGSSVPSHLALAVPKNGLDIVFQAGESSMGAGFDITVRQLKKSCIQQSCNVNYTDQMFEIKSPTSISGTTYCLYTVQKVTDESICFLQVKFDNFDVDERDNCTRSYILFSDTKICGKKPKDHVETYSFPNTVTTILFYSDGTRPADFSLQIYQMECM